MFLNEKATGHMVEILDLDALFNLYKKEVRGRYQFGEEQHEPESFEKSALVFLSGEALPRCWTDPEYRHAR